MSFSWKQFLFNLAALSPIIVAGTAQLAGEADTATKTKLATDSLNLATGVSGALTTGSPEAQAIAALASQITGAVITATSQAHAAAGLPTLHADTGAANQVPAPTAQNPAIIGVSGTAKQVG